MALMQISDARMVEICTEKIQVIKKELIIKTTSLVSYPCSNNNIYKISTMFFRSNLTKLSGANKLWPKVDHCIRMLINHKCYIKAFSYQLKIMICKLD